MSSNSAGVTITRSAATTDDRAAHIRYRALPDGDWSGTSQLNGASTGLSSLSPGTRYGVEVSRYSRFPVGGAQSATFETLAAGTPAAVNVDNLVLKDQKLTVSWRASNTEGLLGYDVRVVRSDTPSNADPQWTPHTLAWRVGDAALTYTITGLENEVAYDVQARPVNAVGDGAWSSTRKGTPAIQNLDPSFVGETWMHEVSESVDTGAAIGSPTVATDPGGDVLTYTIRGGHDLFAVDENTGQLRTKATLDADASVTRHSFCVEVTDALNSSDEEDPAIDDTIAVTVTITGVDEPPEIDLRSAGSGVTANGSHLAVDENHTGTVATFAANDPESKAGLTYIWSVGGTDRLDFAVTDAGVLSFAAIPDYERPADSGGNNVYDITLSALASDDKRGSIDVTVDPVQRPAYYHPRRRAQHRGGQHAPRWDIPGRGPRARHRRGSAR